MWYLYTMEFYAAMKNKMLSLADKIGDHHPEQG
jgi:hypothetical protein